MTATTAAGDQPGYLIINGVLHRLQPLEAVAATDAEQKARALVLEQDEKARALLLEQARAEARRVIEAADAESTRRLSAARRNAETITMDAQRLRELARVELYAAQNRRNVPVPAPWMIEYGVVFRYLNGDEEPKLALRVLIDVQLKAFDFDDGKRTHTWNALAAPPVPVTLWLPVDPITGAFAITTIRVDADSPLLPHIDSGSGCLAPGDTPDALLTLRDYHRMQQAVERTMQRVQLDSLFVGAEKWVDTFRAFIPADLYETIEEGYEYDEMVTLVAEGTSAVVDRKVAAIFTEDQIVDVVSEDEDEDDDRSDDEDDEDRDWDDEDEDSEEEDDEEDEEE